MLITLACKLVKIIKLWSKVNSSFDEAKGQGKLKWAYEFRRIKFTLSKKKREKLLQMLAKYNDDLQKLMGSSDRLALSRQRRKTPLTKFYQRVRDHAFLLHRALTAGWRCECRSSHNANLLLENRVLREPTAKWKPPNLREIQFTILFQSGRIQSEFRHLPWTWQETEVRILEELSGSPSPGSPVTPGVSHGTVSTYSG